MSLLKDVNILSVQRVGSEEVIINTGSEHETEILRGYRQLLRETFGNNVEVQSRTWGVATASRTRPGQSGSFPRKTVASGKRPKSRWSGGLPTTSAKRHARRL